MRLILLFLVYFLHTLGVLSLLFLGYFFLLILLALNSLLLKCYFFAFLGVLFKLIISLLNSQFYFETFSSLYVYFLLLYTLTSLHLQNKHSSSDFFSSFSVGLCENSALHLTHFFQIRFDFLYLAI